MKMRLLSAALLLFGSAAPAAAQFRSSPVGSVPTLTPSLGGGAMAPTLGGFGPSLSGGLTLSAPSLAGSLTPSLPAPSLTTILPPALVPSVIPSAAAVPSFAAAPVPAALVPGASISAPSRSQEGPKGDGVHRSVVYSLKDLHLLTGAVDPASADRVFDGSVERHALVAPADAPLPIGAYGVSTVRVHTPAEAAAYIPQTANTKDYVNELRQRWSRIEWLDLRLYRDASGNFFRAVDLTGRPDLVEHLPELQAHEVALVKKIQLHTADLQIVLREEGKTPDLIVDGVVTEMKSLHAEGIVTVQLEHADAQLKAHSQRHGLGKGAVAIDIVGKKRDWSEIGAAIKEYVATHDVGFDRVEVYNGDERRVFADEHPAKKKQVLAGKTNARFLVPNSLVEAPEPDPQVVLREITEPAKRLREAGVKATVTVYGSARILPPAQARAELDALIKKWGNKPKYPEARKLVYAAKQAVEVSKYYEIARRFGAIVAENGGGEVAVVTGGGPGIMEAANRGAFESGGPSVGYNIHLDKEQGLNAYATPGLDFEFQHFATRKMALRHGAMALVYFPGGFGTMDELFEVLTLMQTRKMKRVPIVLVGEKAYWDKILDFDEFARMGLISEGDLSLFRFADTAEGAWKAIVSPAAPVLTAR